MRKNSSTFKKPTFEDLSSLLEHQPTFAVSIYMNTDEVGLEPTKRKADFQNAEKKIMDTLAKLQAPELDQARIRENLRWLYTDDAVWQLDQKALAFFVAPNFADFFQLPIEVRDIIHVSDRFHLKSLIKVLTEPLDFCLLELSEEKAKMLKGDRYEMTEVQSADLPTIEGVVGVETDARHLQFHTSTATPRGGERAASFHGQSSPWIDDKHRYVRRYLQAVDKLVMDSLEDQKTPLILSGTERVLTMYKELTKYPLVVAQTVPDNDKSRSWSVLHEQALSVAENFYLNQKKNMVEELLKTGDSARFTDNIDEMLREAELGRVDMVLVAQGQRDWGRFDPFTLTVKHEQKQTAHDLLDTICAVTMQKGGKAYVLPPEHMPAHKTAIAVFRY